jgi:hypothetical protein
MTASIYTMPRKHPKTTLSATQTLAIEHVRHGASTFTTLVGVGAPVEAPESICLEGSLVELRGKEESEGEERGREGGRERETG